MQIIIIGGGEIGYALAKALASDHELCVVDTVPGVADRFGLLDVEFQVGPMANYGHLHPLSKLVLTGAMWVGRLEVLTVLALLRPEVWRSAHWRTAARG